MECDYVNAASEAASYLGPAEDNETDVELSDDVVDMYTYADAKANNSSWNGFETMSSDMIVTGGQEVSPEELNDDFDSEADNFDFNDVEYKSEKEE